MFRRRPDPDAEALKLAHAWMARLKSGEATTDDAAAFRAWRAADPAHEAAWAETVRLWEASGAAAAAVRRRDVAPRRAISRRMVLGGGAVAASAAITGLGAVRLGLLPAPADLLADHATGTGERREITLPDGSRAALDARTALDVDMAPGRRRLTLIHGATVVDVAGGLSPALEVRAGPGVARADAGSFTIRQIPVPADDPGGMRRRVVCIAGSVSVTAGETRELLPGQAVDYDDTGCGPVVGADAALEIAWRQGLMVFRDRRVDEIVFELNRYRPGRVILLDDTAAARRLSGVFHLDRTDEVVAHLERMLALPARDLPGGIVLIG
ncbi:DUF4880 domain-containing protein (plasmid) [Tistrella mobilis]|uniref:FecR family protein n=1 Tax=Tistrella mobilis TaxID=171437 RepID=UPI0035564B2B